MKKMKNAVMRTLGLRSQIGGGCPRNSTSSWFWMLYHHM